MQWIEDLTELQRNDHENELIYSPQRLAFSAYLHSDSRIVVFSVISCLQICCLDPLKSIEMK